MKYNEQTKMWESPYWHPAVTTDAVIFGFDDKGLEILLIRRGLEPFKNCWALPGGFLQENEPTDECVKRELEEETCIGFYNAEGIKPDYVEQLQAFSSRDRDPREYVLTVAYYALVRKSEYQIKGGDDAAEARWFSVNDLPELAFDHKNIIDFALKRLRRIINFEPIGFHLLGETFTMPQLQSIYEAISGKEWDRNNFRKTMSSMKYIEKTGKKLVGNAYRSPDLYRFIPEEYIKAKEEGIKLMF